MLSSYDVEGIGNVSCPVPPRKRSTLAVPRRAKIHNHVLVV